MCWIHVPAEYIRADQVLNTVQDRIVSHQLVHPSEQQVGFCAKGALHRMAQFCFIGLEPAPVASGIRYIQYPYRKQVTVFTVCGHLSGSQECGFGMIQDSHRLVVFPGNLMDAMLHHAQV